MSFVGFLNMKLNLPPYDLPVKLLGYLFSTINYLYVQEKKEEILRSSDVDGKREIACFHVDTATGKRAKWRENQSHVVTFAVRVSRIRDAKSNFHVFDQNIVQSRMAGKTCL